jgi:hypothetical protein
MVISLRHAQALAFILLLGCASAQVFDPFQKKQFRIIGDTVLLDSLSLVKGSVKVTTFPGDSSLRPEVNYSLHALIFKGKRPDSVGVSYRRFPYDLEKKHFHKNANDLYSDIGGKVNPYTIRYGRPKQESIFQQDGLNKNGNISRGITFGNNQDVVVNSNLNLQLNGKLTPEIDIAMAATDNNIPFQADGTTAQLQEFDKVYIQLSNKTTKLIGGDYQLSRPQNSYFMSFYKRAQGIHFENNYRDSSAKTPLTFKTQLSGAVSKGKFSRMVFFGTESNQGPYKLRGADNELFIIVLSGTERIYIDGKLLQRGQENDYVIDYNTAELTFTAKQLITKDKRIVAEFQYAERNYARSLLFFGETVESKKSSFFLNVYSEQDNKNRDLQQTLTQDQKNVLIGVGDSLSQAVYSGVREDKYSNTRVYYRKLDTLAGNSVFTGVYAYSTNSEVALYTIQFSFVGENKGNYRQISSAANGKVYEWVAPVNGKLQGSYEPVIPLIAPKQQQMFTAGFTHSLSANNAFSVEGVYTRNDINTFSNRDKGNDEGSGVKVASKNQHVFWGDGPATRFIYNANYEFVQKRFMQVERFRSIEFDRDWNRPLTGKLRNDQHLASAEIGLLKSGSGGITLASSMFEEGREYSGKRQQVNAGFSSRPMSAQFIGSYLTSGDQSLKQNSSFYRHTSLISKRIDRIKLQYNDVFENNLFYDQGNGHLLPRSYRFWEWEGSVSNADSSSTNIKLFYRERRDKLSYNKELRDSTFARGAGLQASVYAIKNNPFTVLITYRSLDLKNVVGNFLKPDNTFLNRLEYNPRYFKGFITAGVFYETGYGLENKKEFYYLEVAPGQGQYAWIDYNGNDLRELNEFEVARFNDQARYIRIYTPTNQYVKVLQNQFSLSFNVRPSSLFKNVTKPASRFINRWNFQTALRWDNKVTDFGGNDRFNPFLVVHDSLLQAANKNARQSIFFNQSSPFFGADYTYINNLSRQLLTNGIEQRVVESNQVRWRVAIFKAWSVNSDNTVARRGNSSQFFFSRNYMILSYEAEQKLIFQPNTVFRISAIYKYTDRKNMAREGFQKAIHNSYGMELKLNQTEKGSLTGRADYVKILYNDDPNSPVGYEMLNGLSNGDNFTWELTYQRNLNSNIQVSINYNGRKTPNAGAVHIGGAQVRAYF